MNRGGGIYSLDIVDGATIKRVIDERGRTPEPPYVAYQQIIKGIPATDYSRDQLIYRPRNIRSWKLYGYSPVEQVIMTVNIAIRRQLHQLQYYTEGTMPDTLIGVPLEWSAAQIKDFQGYFDALLSGDTGMRRKAKFVPGGMEPYATRESPLKDEYDDWIARVICYAFSISHDAFVKMMNRATAEVSKDSSLEQGLAVLKQW
jgi:hypothetical protein